MSSDGARPVGRGYEQPFELSEVSFDERGLVPVVVQDAADSQVLMLAYANEEAIEKTVATGRAHYYSRSRERLWRKGDESGNLQTVQEVVLDCDGDTVLYRVRQTGPACHTGSPTCFFRGSTVAGIKPDEHRPHETERQLGRALALLDSVVADRLQELPDASYVTRLHQRGLGYVAQKVVEEAGETVVAALLERDEELIGEAADLLFHLAVLLRERGLGLSAVAVLLEERHRSRAPVADDQSSEAVNGDR